MRLERLIGAGEIDNANKKRQIGDGLNVIVTSNIRL